MSFHHEALAHRGGQHALAVGGILLFEQLHAGLGGEFPLGPLPIRIRSGMPLLSPMVHQKIGQDLSAEGLGVLQAFEQ